jgi:hypothetical protein
VITELVFHTSFTANWSELVEMVGKLLVLT